MTKLFVISVSILGIVIAAGHPSVRATDEAKKAARDPRQAIETYLAAVVAGKVETATALAVPGSAEDSMTRLAEYKAMIADKSVKVATLHVSAKSGRAFAVTEVVRLAKALRDGRDKGPLIIKLSKQNERWLIRDLDFGTADAAKQQLKEFLDRYPDAKPADGKK